MQHGQYEQPARYYHEYVAHRQKRMLRLAQPVAFRRIVNYSLVALHYMDGIFGYGFSYTCSVMFLVFLHLSSEKYENRSGGAFLFIEVFYMFYYKI